MQTPERKLYRLASTIHEQLVQLHRNRYQEVLRQVRNLLDCTDSLRRWHQRMTTCLGRNWPGAARRVGQRLNPTLTDLPFYIREIERLVDTTKTACPCPSDILAEIRQAEMEFGRIDYDPKAQVLSVATDTIELEHIYLGEFSIQLHILDLGRMSRARGLYRIVALDPHPATANESVTHPHVRDEELCAGDASAPIQAALSTGRICDFFLLVRAVLTTYNRHSPYVPLTEWSGTACSDCGYVMDSDHSYYCEHCQSDYCDECSAYCRRCDCTLCRSCQETCPACDQPVCPSCLTCCPDCKRPICTTCLEAGECACHQEEDETDEPQPQETPASQEA